MASGISHRPRHDPATFRRLYQEFELSVELHNALNEHTVLEMPPEARVWGPCDLLRVNVWFGARVFPCKEPAARGEIDGLSLIFHQDEHGLFGMLYPYGILRGTLILFWHWYVWLLKIFLAGVPAGWTVGVGPTIKG